MDTKKLIQAFQYLVVYRGVLEDRIERNKRELNFFEGVLRELVEDSLKDAEKELVELDNLIKNWRDGW